MSIGDDHYTSPSSSLSPLSSPLSSSSTLSSSPIKDDKKTSGKGLNITALPILLSKLNINSSKELKINIKNLLKHLYNTKQITKQVYNNLIETITYKNDS